MDIIEKLDDEDFIRHDFERHLLMKKINEIIEVFNKSITPQTPKPKEKNRIKQLSG